MDCFTRPVERQIMLLPRYWLLWFYGNWFLKSADLFFFSFAYQFLAFAIIFPCRCSPIKVMMVQQLIYGLVGSFCLSLWLDTCLLMSRTSWLCTEKWVSRTLLSICYSFEIYWKHCVMNRLVFRSTRLISHVHHGFHRVPKSWLSVLLTPIHSLWALHPLFNILLLLFFSCYLFR